MKLQKFKEAVLRTIDKLHSESGDEFLELMIDTIIIRDQNNDQINTFYGLEYNLSRSRHWDKEEKNYILYDGFTDEHLKTLYQDIMTLHKQPAYVTIFIDGMNDLDEPIREQIDLELSNINE
ncbi:MAG: hypothetical protein K0B52_03250 [FCB group bacterium]|nr:hypothetical protein [FCB group bacterium]